MNIEDKEYPKIDGQIVHCGEVWYKYDESKDEWVVLTDHPPASEAENA